MPHLTIEATDNLNPLIEPVVLLQSAHQVLLDSGVFDGADVKSRLLWLDAFLVGTSGRSEGFIHASLDLLAGRSSETCRQLAAAVVDALQSHVAAHCSIAVQISCNVRTMERDSYAKHIS